MWNGPIFSEIISEGRDCPSPAVELSLPGEIASFLAETDMLEAGTGLRLEMKDGKVFEGGNLAGFPVSMCWG